MSGNTPLVGATSTTDFSSQDLKVRKIIADGSTDVGGVRNTNPITWGFSCKYAYNLPTFSTGINVNCLHKPNVLIAKFALGGTVENENYKATGDCKSGFASMLGLDYQPMLFSAGNNIDIDKIKRRFNHGCHVTAVTYEEKSKLLQNGLYLKLSGANINSYTSKDDGSYVNNYNHSNFFDGYAGLKYVGGQGKYSTDTGVKMNNLIQGGKEYQLGFTGSFWKPTSISGREFFFNAKASYNPAIKKVDPSVTIGVAF